MSFEEALRIYGPLIMGWVAAWVLWKENVRNADRYHEEKERDIEHKIQVLNALEKLSESYHDGSR